MLLCVCLVILPEFLQVTCKLVYECHFPVFLSLPFPFPSLPPFLPLGYGPSEVCCVPLPFLWVVFQPGFLTTSSFLWSCFFFVFCFCFLPPSHSCSCLHWQPCSWFFFILFCLNWDPNSFQHCHLFYLLIEGLFWYENESEDTVFKDILVWTLMHICYLLTLLYNHYIVYYLLIPVSYIRLWGLSVQPMFIE